MKKIAFASIVTAGLAGAVLGLASPLRRTWATTCGPTNQNGHTTAAQVDTTVHQVADTHSQKDGHPQGGVSLT